MHTILGLPQPPAQGGVRRLIVMLLALVLLSACASSTRAEEEIRKEIQALKAQVTALQEKLNQVQTGQQAILDQLKQLASPVAQPVTPVAPPATPPAAPLAVPSQPPGPETLTVDQLLAGKDRYLGTRVKVKGMPGPVMVHHKSLMLKGPQGMVEVLFGNLPDPRLIQTLSSSALEKPLTVTGVVNLPPARGGGAQLQINAEAVEF
jgi:outer membrane murein-binding lipoprotein Lpp